jgi:hypothetical protein
MPRIVVSQTSAGGLHLFTTLRTGDSPISFTTRVRSQQTCPGPGQPGRDPRPGSTKQIRESPRPRQPPPPGCSVGKYTANILPETDDEKRFGAAVSSRHRQLDEISQCINRFGADNKPNVFADVGSCRSGPLCSPQTVPGLDVDAGVVRV